MRPLKIKDHVSKKTGRIRKKFKKTFGVSPHQITLALLNHEKSQNLIADMANDGEVISKFAPKVLERMKHIIEGTKDLNRVHSEVAKLGGDAINQIQKYHDDSELANTKYVNTAEEQKLSFTSAKDKESLRHKNAIALGTLQKWLAKHTEQIDGEYKYNQTQLNTETKNQQINLEYDEKLGEYRLDMGSDFNPELLPKKQYAPLEVVKRIATPIKETLLGF